MADHTPEPWQVRATEELFDNIVDDSSGVIVADVYRYRAGWQANARRIVACVNAFAGTPTEKIEAMIQYPLNLEGCLDEAARVVADVRAGQATIARQAAAIERIRRELDAAVRCSLSQIVAPATLAGWTCDPCGGDGGSAEAIHHENGCWVPYARAALAETEAMS